MVHGTPWAAFSSYDDCGEVMELAAVYDDALKKDDTFTSFAVEVGQRIAAGIDSKAVITWGKWGARIEPSKNQHLTRSDISQLAERIIRHPSWTGLTLATWVFTYGTELEDAVDESTK